MGLSFSVQILSYLLPNTYTSCIHYCRCTTDLRVQVWRALLLYRTTHLEAFMYWEDCPQTLCTTSVWPPVPMEEKGQMLQWQERRLLEVGTDCLPHIFTHVCCHCLYMSCVSVYPPEIFSVTPTEEQGRYRMTINSFQTTYGPLRYVAVCSLDVANSTLLLLSYACTYTYTIDSSYTEYTTLSPLFEFVVKEWHSIEDCMHACSPSIVSHTCYAKY